MRRNIRNDMFCSTFTFHLSLMWTLHTQGADLSEWQDIRNLSDVKACMIEVNPNVMCGISPKWPEAKSTIHAAVSAMQIPVRPDTGKCCVSVFLSSAASTVYRLRVLRL